LFFFSYISCCHNWPLSVAAHRARVFAARGKGQWCRPSNRQHPSLFHWIFLIDKYKLTLTHCNANAKIPNFNTSKCRPLQSAAVPRSLPAATAIISGKIRGGGHSGHAIKLFQAPQKLVLPSIHRSIDRSIDPSIHPTIYNASLKRFKVLLHVGVALEDGVRNKFCKPNMQNVSYILSPNTSSSIDNRNINIFPYKLNLFTNKSVQRCRALSNMQRLPGFPLFCHLQL